MTVSQDILLRTRVEWRVACCLAGACLLFMSGRSLAGQKTEAEVRAATETWLRQAIVDRRTDAEVARMSAHKVAGSPVAYIAELKGEGFCLCGADDLVLPVYFYSPHGTYDPTDPTLEYFLWEIGERVEVLRDAMQRQDPTIQPYIAELTQRAADWQALISGYAPSSRCDDRAAPVSMVLPLTCHWGQGSPYNRWCPLLGPDEYTVTGCVATATAQTMYYWKWPSQGQGMVYTTYNRWLADDWIEEPLATDPGIPANWPWLGRLEWTASSGGRLRMSGLWDGSLHNGARKLSEDGDYRDALDDLFDELEHVPVEYGITMEWVADWDQIHDVHTNPYGEEDSAVAALCYAMGVAMGMNYGLLVSGAYTSDAIAALEDHCFYDADGRYDGRNIDMMMTEIQWLRPLVLDGYAESGAGHAWVVYGYDRSTDPNRRFKMNFGWYGGNDGWYSCDSVDYLIDQHHATQIAPESIVRFVGDDDSGDGSPGDPYLDIAEAVTDAPSGTTLIFKAGTTNTFPMSSLIINRPMTLRGYQVVIDEE